MGEVLVAYASGEGQTEKVAAVIAAVLRERGHDVTVRRVTEDAPSVEEFDAVLVGSSVNNRAHRPEAVAYIEENVAPLADRPSGFFQLSLASAARSRWARRGATAFVDDLTDQTGWYPDRVGLFAGALKYSQYGRVERQLFRLAAAATTGDTDTSRDYEYTDWVGVESFARQFSDDVESGDETTANATRRPRARRLARGVTGVAALAVVGVILYWLGTNRVKSRRR